MLTFAESRQHTPGTADEIVDYLSEAFQAMQEGTSFCPGDKVSITSRAGLASEIGIGDVGVMLCDLPNQLHSWVLVFAAGGQPLSVQILTANLAKREGADR